MSTSKRLICCFLFCLLITAPFLLNLSSVLNYKVPADKQFLKGEIARDFERNFDELHTLKTLSKNTWAAISLLLFNEGRDGVVIGKHSWLFSDEEIDISKNSDENYKKNLASIIASNELLSKKNVTLVIAIIPAKSRIYSSYLKDTPPSDQHKQLYALIHKDLAEHNILAPDLLNQLFMHSNSAFLKTDTHWTPDGAEITAKSIAEFINERKLLDISTKEFVTQATGKIVHRGDLLNYLPLQPWFTFLYPYTDSVEVRKTTLKQTSDNVADMLFSENDIAIDLVGTSYSANSLWNFNGALQQALGTDVLNMAKEGQGPITPMKNYLNEKINKQNLPKLVIWEFPERYLLMDNG